MKIETKNKDSSFNRLFWDDPFFDTFSQRSRAKLLVSDTVEIEVFPLQNIPKNFTGAVGNFSLNTSLSNSNIDEGTPLEFKVSLVGEGNLSNIGRPKIEFPDEFDVFEGETNVEKNITDDYSGSITWNYNLIPRKDGLYNIDSIEIPFFNSTTKSWSKAFSNDISLKVNKSAVFDSSDKDILNSKSNVIKYIRVGDQKWISSSSSNIQSSIFYILFIALVLFTLPYFTSSFVKLRSYINEYIKLNTALNNAIHSIEETNSVHENGMKIIIKYFFQKNILINVNIDLLSLKSILKDKIKIEDFDSLSKHLNEFQKKSYSQFKDHKDDNKIKKSLKNILKRIDAYV